MVKLHRNKRCLKALVITILVVFATSAWASDLDSARIMPSGKVSIYRGDQRVGELTAEAPLPVGDLLACEGDCAVRLDDFLLVGADKSLFSITAKPNSRELAVKKGTVYFALTELRHSLVFATPGGAVTVQQLILNAANAAEGNTLKGYVEVSDETSEIGVIEGGSMRVSAGDEETTIQSGQKIMLAQNETGETTGDETDTPPENESKNWQKPALIGAGVLAAGIAAIAIASSGGGGGGGGGGGNGSSSPSSP